MSTDSYILGIACFYHDASACLLKNGEVFAAAEEERFTRIKHDSSFPSFAIEYCLAEAGIDVQDLEAICFYEKPFKKFERIIHQYLHKLPPFSSFVAFLNNWLADLQELSHKEREDTVKLKHSAFRPGFQVLHERFGKLYIKSIIRNILKFDKEIYFCDHHQSHAASSFYPSSFDAAAIVTIDGVGEWSTLTYGTGKDNRIQLKSQIAYPHSLGLLYSTITAYLGFSVNNSEYKVMGLSSYGNTNAHTNPYMEKFRRLIDVKDDGSFRLNLDFFAFHRSKQMYSEELEQLMGIPARTGESELTQAHKDIAAALQMTTEEVVFKVLNHVHRETGLDSLCMAGGVALNSVLNGKILQNTPFKQVSIHPCAGDGGASLGAALFCQHQILGKTERARKESAYLGPEFSNEQIRFYLDGNGINYQQLSGDRDLIDTTASLIAKGAVVGWFQGRMEWGPRALGARSILANPSDREMQHTLNCKVKHREQFRPFAPAVCLDDAMTYFDCDSPIPDPADFMLMVYPIREAWREKIPAVTHVDGSGRLQVVKEAANSRYYKLIKKVGEITGIPIVINTSFNIRGEPIVCTPDDAYTCMMGTEIDYLVIGDFLVEREANSQDMWDSESLAND